MTAVDTEKQYMPKLDKRFRERYGKSEMNKNRGYHRTLKMKISRNILSGGTETLI